MGKLLQLSLCVCLIAVAFFFGSVVFTGKVLAYGDCDYSEGSYGSDCDNVAPTGSVLINGGNATTNSRNVTLRISATDNMSGVKEMMISESQSFQGASWVSYTTSKSFTLSTGFGTKTVYIKFRDYIGNTSSTYFDRIEYISTAIGDIIEEATAEEEIAVIPPEETVEEHEGETYYKLKLVDKDGNPLVGVKVIIEELGIQAVTDEDGIINLGYVEEKDYKVIIEYEGKTYEKVLGVGGDSETITLKFDNEEDGGLNILYIVLAVGGLIGGGFIGLKLLQRYKKNP